MRTGGPGRGEKTSLAVQDPGNLLTSELEIYHEAGPKIVAVRLLTLEAGARLRKLIELMMTGQKEISSLTRKRENTEVGGNRLMRGERWNGGTPATATTPGLTREVELWRL